jgi:hypothetical protein
MMTKHSLLTDDIMVKTLDTHNTTTTVATILAYEAEVVSAKYNLIDHLLEIITTTAISVRYARKPTIDYLSTLDINKSKPGRSIQVRYANTLQLTMISINLLINLRIERILRTRSTCLQPYIEISTVRRLLIALILNYFFILLLNQFPLRILTMRTV